MTVTEIVQRPAPRLELGPRECRDCLDEIMPQVGDYRWIWSILRSRPVRPRYTRVYAALQRFIDPQKPYFIGETGSGVRFLGDCRDSYSIDCVIEPDYDDTILNF